MTVMISFRADEEVVTVAGQWAERLGIDRSELLREALARHLAWLATETKGEAEPFTPQELALDGADDWDPAEDWSDWAEPAQR
jgi:hypothetical protein